MRALDRKLIRDLRHGRGQALAIGAVVTAGAAMLVAYLATFASLRDAQQGYYAQSRFADVFASMRRAPASVVDRVRELPGVARAEGRIVLDVPLEIEGVADPMTARLVSMPLPRRDRLNDTIVRLGADPERMDQALVSEAFATARRLRPGDRVAAIVNGRRTPLEVHGLALSPEFIYTIRPGELMPDNARFGVFWVDERMLAAAYDLTGGVNSVQVSLTADAIGADVIARIDRLLAPYGGVGAIGRAHQPSHFFVDNELTQLQNVGIAIPSIFFLVAAVLLHVAMTRLVAVQREQIAALKALGYTNRELTVHFVEWAVIVSVAGAAAGIAGGAWIGVVITDLYNQFFQFPSLTLYLPVSVVLLAFGVSVLSAIGGATHAVHRAVGVPPAVAMRPEAPMRFRETWIERAGLKRYFSQPARMVFRNIARQPLRAVTTVGGVAVSLALVILGTFALDAIHVLIEQQFFVADRYDAAVTFLERAPARVAYTLARVPGVLEVEPYLTVGARMRHAHRSRLVGIRGVTPDAHLSRAVTRRGEAVRPDGSGLVLTDALASALGVGVGEDVEVEVLEGSRVSRLVRVSRTVDEYMGLNAYMDLDALRSLARTGDSVSGAFVKVDERLAPAAYEQWGRAPRIAAVSVKRAALDTFNKTMEDTQYVSIFFNVLFSACIAAGVVYNAARVSLSERARDLATLRVLGFTRAEISGILLGELAALTIVGIPLGLVLGYAGAWGLVGLFETELFRFPLAISAKTCLLATVAVVGATVGSALFVRRKLDRLDLVSVLKSRE